MEKKKKRRRRSKKWRVIELRLKIAVFCLAVIGGLTFLLKNPVMRLIEKIQSTETSVDTENGEPQFDVFITPGASDATGATDWMKWLTGTDNGEITATQIHLQENSIYTFMQGPRAWNSGTDWSGEWCEEALAGSKFSIFGCGLCDLANIYSTLSPYECSPIDMYYFAKDHTGYSPGGGSGAIDWPYMEDALWQTGFACEVGNKDEAYEDFQKKIASCLTAIVLVSSYNDSSYWSDTEGHYVNIWMYNPESDKVFLGDSGDPAHNRSWIPLKYVYNALKTSGSHQYLLVYSYNENENSWKHSGITEDWAVPDYYRRKLTDN